MNFSKLKIFLFVSSFFIATVSWLHMHLTLSSEHISVYRRDFMLVLTWEEILQVILKKKGKQRKIWARNSVHTKFILISSITRKSSRFSETESLALYLPDVRALYPLPFYSLIRSRNMHQKTFACFEGILYAFVAPGLQLK